MFRVILILVLVVLAGFVLIQLVPYGHNHTNPPVVTQVQWDSAQTEQLVRASCFDCHSNETTWYWFSNIAPASWLIQHDVEEGRQRLNFSDLNTSRVDMNEIDEAITRGKMPPLQYVLIHPNARLNTTQKEQLEMGLQQSLGSALPSSGGRE